MFNTLFATDMLPERAMVFMFVVPERNDVLSFTAEMCLHLKYSAYVEAVKLFMFNS